MYGIYERAFRRKVDAACEDSENRELLKQLIFYGVRYMNLGAMHGDRDETELKLGTFCALFTLMGDLTPVELLTVFPVEKRYGGRKFGCEDYFDTIHALREIGMNQEIGPRIRDLLCRYQNDELREFLTRFTADVSDMCVFRGDPSIGEQVAKDMEIDSYHLDVDHETHQQYLVNERTKEAWPLRSPSPRYENFLSHGGGAIGSAR